MHGDSERGKNVWIVIATLWLFMILYALDHTVK